MTVGQEAVAAGVGAAVAAHRPRWWVLRTKARQEKAVTRSLEAAGVEFFMPVQKRKQPWAHGGRVFAVPLFPGYVFARYDGTFSDRELGIGRVVQVIRVDEQARLEHELAQIRNAIDAGAVLVPAKYLEKGTHVVVTSGPLKGTEGFVDGLARADLLYLQVYTLGRAVTVEISPLLIAPVR